MEAYPTEYVLHNLPFIVLSGLDTTTGELEPLPPIHQVLPGRATTTINSEIPPVTGDRAHRLLQEFLSADGTNAPWNSREGHRRDNTLGFRLRTVGRVGQDDPIILCDCNILINC